MGWKKLIKRLWEPIQPLILLAFLNGIDKLVDTVLDGMKEALARGENIEIRGFGNFRIKQRDGRVARNPKTGETVHVPPKNCPSLQNRKAFSRRAQL